MNKFPQKFYCLSIRSSAQNLKIKKMSQVTSSTVNNYTWTPLDGSAWSLIWRKYLDKTSYARLFANGGGHRAIKILEPRACSSIRFSPQSGHLSRSYHSSTTDGGMGNIHCQVKVVAQKVAARVFFVTRFTKMGGSSLLIFHFIHRRRGGKYLHFRALVL